MSASDGSAGERALRAVMDAALPALLEMVREYEGAGGDVAAVAGCVIRPDAAGPLGEPRPHAEAMLVPRERARVVAEQVAPEHAHVLEGRAAPGHFHVVAVAGEFGAVVALELPGAAAAD